MNKRIYISGASGAGVSTLGAALAAKLQVPHFDVDDYYWYPTEPPFERSRPPAERVDLLNRSLADGQWVLSGSLDGWGDEVIQSSNLVVFVDTPTLLRVERLKARESQRYGQRILPGGDMHANHLAFLAWAEGYESGAQAGRSRPRHEQWLKQLTLPSVRVSGELPIESLLAVVIAAIPN
ncbi:MULTISPECIES: adenylate kinase [Pseudomonas]|uniref:adenylate kinase n=1 Tax=Pseudomonas TaxID=286 RepID=UPI002113BD55|nr:MULTISPECIES: adenylate kinase [unclassified Pseudomonas]